MCMQAYAIPRQRDSRRVYPSRRRDDWVGACIALISLMKRPTPEGAPQVLLSRSEMSMSQQQHVEVAAAVVDIDKKMTGDRDSRLEEALAAYLVWTDLCVHTVSVKRQKKARPILVGATGYAEPGSLTAIMGPSGSGKTTLLDALAGRLLYNTVQTGNIFFNGEKKSSLCYGAAAYVTQQDFLIGTLTVRESIMYSASLRFPNTTTFEEKTATVDSTILEMGLVGCQNTYVGNYFVRGLSGGEKRRLSIALGILTRPSLIFLDEPTSGLDSAAAYFVARTLKNLAKDGRTVIAAIHQPSSEVFALFDHLTLLSSGQTIFFGESAKTQQFFAASKHPCPPMRNPSDHYLQIINADFDSVRSSLKGLHVDLDNEESVDPLLLNSRKSTEQMVKTLTIAYHRSEYFAAAQAKITQILSYTSTGEFMQKSVLARNRHHGGTSFLGQCKTLTKRSFVNMTRDLGYYWLRVVMYVMVGVCLGTIFWQVGQSYSSIMARAAVVFFVSGFLTFMSICGFPAFVEDMRVFYHDRLSGYYGVGAFVVGNTLSSIPFLFLIALSSGTLVYSMSNLHPGFEHYSFFVLMLFASLTCVESLMMAIASFVGHNFLTGLIIGAGFQGVSIMLAGYFRLAKDLPKPIWRYPGSYISLHAYTVQGLFKNDLPGLLFKNILGPENKPIDPDLSGEYILHHFYGVTTTRSKWGDLGIIFSMIVAYRILFLVFIKLIEKLGPRFKVFAREYLYCAAVHQD